MTPACQRTAHILLAVNDDQLGGPTPCEQMRTTDLLAHIGGLSLAFEAAARKQFGPLTDTVPSYELDPGWRDTFPTRLDGLALAWADPSAWQGMSRAGGVDFPAEIGGIIALTEVVIHGWDLARATGQPYDIDAATADAVLLWVTQSAAEGPTEGLFGPAVAVADDAPLLDRIIALSGRDPAWAPKA